MQWKDITYGSQGNGFRWKTVSADIPFMEVGVKERSPRRLDLPFGEEGLPFTHAAFRQPKLRSCRGSKTPFRFGSSKGRNLC